MWLLAAVAYAGPIFLEASEPIRMDADGNWPRLFSDGAGGWHLLFATQGEYNYQHLDGSFQRGNEGYRPLTGSTVLRDHGVSVCPDGTYLDAATAGLEHDNDTLYLYRYSADFQIIDRTTVYERSNAARVFADVPSVCGNSFRGVAWFMPWDSVNAMYLPINADMSFGEEVALRGAPSAMGSSLLEDDGTLRVTGFEPAGGKELVSITYDMELSGLREHRNEVVPVGWSPYWAQASMRVGDTLIVAYMAQDDRYDWAAQAGDLWVAAFDREGNMVDHLQLSQNTAPKGGMHPGLARVDDLLVVSYALEVEPFAFELRLDLEAAGWEAGGDSGEADGDTGEAGDDTGEAYTSVGQASEDDQASCGCNSGTGLGGSGAAALLALLAARGRRAEPRGTRT
ncbi:MAG: hypothetical protein FJ090_03845 [Deltaproteobacteria bacterium]|nr:hypothetical protein [Deltaproteobacteria bacterium]